MRYFAALRYWYALARASEYAICYTIVLAVWAAYYYFGKNYNFFKIKCNIVYRPELQCSCKWSRRIFMSKISKYSALFVLIWVFLNLRRINEWEQANVLPCLLYNTHVNLLNLLNFPKIWFIKMKITWNYLITWSSLAVTVMISVVIICTRTLHHIPSKLRAPCW